MYVLRVLRISWIRDRVIVGVFMILLVMIFCVVIDKTMFLVCVFSLLGLRVVVKRVGACSLYWVNREARLRGAWLSGWFLGSGAWSAWFESGVFVGVARMTSARWWWARDVAWLVRGVVLARRLES